MNLRTIKEITKQNYTHLVVNCRLFTEIYCFKSSKTDLEAKIRPLKSQRANVPALALNNLSNAMPKGLFNIKPRIIQKFLSYITGLSDNHYIIFIRHSLRLNTDVADTELQKSLGQFFKYWWPNLNYMNICIFISNTL